MFHLYFHVQQYLGRHQMRRHNFEALSHALFLMTTPDSPNPAEQYKKPGKQNFKTKGYYVQIRISYAPKAVAQASLPPSGNSSWGEGGSERLTTGCCSNVELEPCFSSSQASWAPVKDTRFLESEAIWAETSE
jgi:hypothetical protein